MNKSSETQKNKESKLKLITVYTLCALSIIGICVKGYFVLYKNNNEANQNSAAKMDNGNKKQEKICLSKYKKLISDNNYTIEKIDSVIMSINNNFTGEKTTNIKKSLSDMKSDFTEYNKEVNMVITKVENHSSRFRKEGLISCEVNYLDHKELSEQTNTLLDEYKKAILPVKQQVVKDQKEGLCKSLEECKKYEDNLFYTKTEEINKQFGEKTSKRMMEEYIINKYIEEYIIPNRVDYINKNESRSTKPSIEEESCYKKFKELKNDMLSINKQFDDLKIDLQKNDLENENITFQNMYLYTAINYQKKILLPTIDETLNHKINNYKVKNCEKEINHDIEVSVKISKEISKLRSEISFANKNIGKYCKILDCKTDEDIKVLKSTILTDNLNENKFSGVSVDVSTVEILNKLTSNNINGSEKAKKCSQLATVTIENLMANDKSYIDYINKVPDNYITGENYKAIKLNSMTYNKMVNNTIFRYLKEISSLNVTLNKEDSCISFLEIFNDYIKSSSKINKKDMEQVSKVPTLVEYSKHKYNCPNLSINDLNCYKANLKLLLREYNENRTNMEELEKIGEKIVNFSDIQAKTTK